MSRLFVLPLKVNLIVTPKAAFRTSTSVILMIYQRHFFFFNYIKVFQSKIHYASVCRLIKTFSDWKFIQSWRSAGMTSIPLLDALDYTCMMKNFPL